MAGSSISFWILSIAGSIKLLTPGLDNTRLSGAHCFCLSEIKTAAIGRALMKERQPQDPKCKCK